MILGFLVLYAQCRRYKWNHEAKLQAESLRQQDYAVTAVIETEEAERRRIVTDLHDGVVQ